MFELWGLVGVLAVAAKQVDGGYMEAGLAVHPVAYDRPEIDLDSLVFQGEIGVRRGPWRVYFQHTSSVATWEKGLGLNTAGLKYQFY